jgi:hypothetical protein
MTTAIEEAPAKPIPAKILAWILAIFVSLGCLFTCLVLLRSIRMFDEMFKGLRVELPAPTKYLMTNYVWLFPAFYGGAAVFSMVKELVVRSVPRRLVTTAAVVMAAVASLGLLHFVLYLPVMDLAQKLARPR